MTENSVLEIPLYRIKTNGRHRKDYGDIAGLAASIEQLGLLQPIGVTLEYPDYRLVFGHRRLLAYQHLGRTHIPVREIDVPALVLAEHAENEIRKDFTVSERVAIGKAVETELGKRQGQRTDLANEEQGKLVEILPQVEQPDSGQKTRELAAQKAGFGSDSTNAAGKPHENLVRPEVAMTPIERASLNFQAPYSREIETFVVCPHCKEPVSRFLVTCDGHLFPTERCRHHGDVIAIRSHVCNRPGIAAHG